MTIAPIAFLLVLEGALHLTGFGNPTSFLLSKSHQGKDVFTQNNRFAWRFLGSRMGRLPEPIFISQQKSPKTVRIFVFGESAAQGDPQPAFGPARLLQVLLAHRYPQTRFEVVNAAMTAINSHAILPIARDCAQADADIWVVYMGNNEVVGPFGAGTIFGAQTLPLPLIRASLSAKSTRTGQLFEAILSASSKSSADWHGMEMFLKQQVRAEDPRMEKVYDNFQENLNDLLAEGRKHNVGMVVSTVAVNLSDCAPFASTHRTDLNDTDRGKWDNFYQSGVKAQERESHLEAAALFQQAALVDNTFAELRFRQGLCAQALGKTDEADTHFAAARDLDTLRFRCDSRLNALIRQSVTNTASEQVLLADVESAFSECTRSGTPEAELFYEHVHPTFKGNYLLARTMAEQVEKFLPAATRNSQTAPWPGEADCARRLMWADWSEQAALEGMLTRISAPPFTGQLNHTVQIQRLKARLEHLSAASSPSRMAEMRAQCEEIAARFPDDPALHGHLAALKLLAGDLDGAAAAEQRELDLLPSNSQAWMRLGMIRARQQKHEDASTCFRQAVELDPADAMLRQNLAQSLWQSGRRDDAMVELRSALKAQPNFTLGWISLGQLLDEAGQRDQAEASYQRALACRSFRTADLLAVARFCRGRGWHEAALTNFTQALNLNPQDAKLRLEIGQTLLTLKQPSVAADHLATAVRQSPDSAPAHQLYGQALGQLGRVTEAEAQFREALRLAPDSLEARLNLGIALMNQSRLSEALSQLDDVLRLSPTNEIAQRYSRMLRGGSAPK